ncbi:MAG: hypothetical protein H6658_06470 [Ardenticatenaceae bacterium]|nr:hypothetical protein [Ardenticatenaceae bacterium]
MTQLNHPPRTQLTDEIEPTANGRQLFITLLSILIILLLVNFAAIWFLDNFPNNRGYWLVKAKWQLLQNLDQSVDWLIVGDSSGNQGLDPAILTAELGGTAVNLATVADMGTLDDAWMLQTYIERFGPPPNLIIVHTFDSWQRTLKPVFIGKSAMPWGAWNSLQPDMQFTFQQKTDIFLARYFPLYADNKSLTQAIMNTVLNGRPFFIRRYQLEPNGFMPQPSASPQRVNQEANALLRSMPNRSFKISDLNQQSLTQLITLAETYDIQIYLAAGPLFEGLMADEQFQRYFAEAQAALQQYDQQSDHFHLLSDPITFPADQMENPDHIVGDSVVRYTTTIAAAIREVAAQD